MPPVRALVFSLILSCAPAVLTSQGARPADAASQARRDRPEVLGVRFVGVQHVDKSDLASSIATQASHGKSVFLEPFCLITKSHFFYEHDYLNRDELRRDVLRILIFYYKHG